MPKYPILEAFVAWVSAKPGLGRHAVEEFESMIQRREQTRATNCAVSRPVVLDPGCSLELHGEISKLKMPRLPPRPAKSEFLGVVLVHRNFLKLLRSFQIASKFVRPTPLKTQLRPLLAA